MSSKISSSRIQIQHAQEEESKKLILISIKRNNLFQLQFFFVTFGYIQVVFIMCIKIFNNDRIKRLLEKGTGFSKK